MRFINVVLITLYVFSAIVQYNDPDPYLWVPIYLYAALLCFLALRNRYNTLLYLAGFVSLTVYALVLLLQRHGVADWVTEHDSESIVNSMKAEKPWIESAREFFGLLIVLLSMALNMLWLRRRRHAKQRPAAS